MIRVLLKPVGRNAFVCFSNLRLGERCLSSQAVSTFLPKNLQLADISVLQPEVKPVIPEEEYYFPNEDVPKTVPILQFSNPGIKSDHVARIDPKIFGVALRKDIVLDVVRYQRHKIRQPKKTKRIGEISGSTKKPRPQKGTGRAQAGNTRASQCKGGMKAHGPVIRDYSIKLNRKFRALGMMIVLAAKLKEGNLIVFDSFNVETGRTKPLVSLLYEHSLSDVTTLFVDSEVNPLFDQASSNIPLLTYIPQQKANVYDIMKREKLIITSLSLSELQKRVMKQYCHRGKYNRILKEKEEREKILLKYQ